MFNLGVLSLSLVTHIFSSAQFNFSTQIVDNAHSLTITNKELVERAGFGYEFYHVQTDDGYLIGLHRIVTRYNRGFPVLFINGFGIRSRSWILRGRGIDFPFLLADNGYDVWLADHRGNPHSRGHTKFSFNENNYWNFSFHEIGIYDLPAVIDFILYKTNYKQLHYIGQSLGSTCYFIMISEREKYNKKIASSTHFAPLGIPPNLEHVSSHLKFMINLEIFILRWLRITNVADSSLKYSIDLMARIILFMCDRSPFQPLCLQWMPLVFGGSMKNFDLDSIGYQMAASIGLTSIKTSEHLAQIYTSGKLRKYDYGRSNNIEFYGRVNPPEYNISKITSPTALFIGNRDNLVPYHASLQTVKALGQFARPYIVQGFNHIEMAFGIIAKNWYIKALHFLNEVTSSNL